eukprot:m.42046 g.42046  ORF g.42046 m.42046 type:complete len:343 (+) comp6072_c0_seq1:650-1678(+)
MVSGLVKTGVAAALLMLPFVAGHRIVLLHPLAVPLYIAAAALATAASPLALLLHAPPRPAHSRDSGDVYGLDHALLNLQVPPPTLWLNLGYHDPNDTANDVSFAAACQALALELASAAQLQPGQSILDVGIGCGDQLALWASHFAPRAITGVTIEAAQARIARQKTADLMLQGGARVHVVQGDAVELDSLALGAEVFDVVLALDTAYHFRTRQRFFHVASKRLGPGGIIALADIVAVDSEAWPTRLVLRLLAGVCDIPFANLVQAAQYKQQMQDAGFTVVHFREIDDFVLPTLSRFLHRAVTLSTLAHPLLLAKYRFLGSLFNFLCRHRLVHFAIAVGRKAP